MWAETATLKYLNLDVQARWIDVISDSFMVSKKSKGKMDTCQSIKAYPTSESIVVA